MTLRPVPQSQASSFISCIEALPEIQARLRTTYDREDAAKFRALTIDELMQARDLAQRHHLSIVEAQGIIRRSRK